MVVDSTGIINSNQLETLSCVPVVDAVVVVVDAVGVSGVEYATVPRWEDQLAGTSGSGTHANRHSHSNYNRGGPDACSLRL